MGATLNQVRLRKYVLSCELLIIPVLVWNIAFTGFLPPALGSQEFWRDIPPMVTYGENLLRLIVLAQLPQFGHRRVFFCPLRSRNPATD